MLYASIFDWLVGPNLPIGPGRPATTLRLGHLPYRRRQSEQVICSLVPTGGSPPARHVGSTVFAGDARAALGITDDAGVTYWVSTSRIEARARKSKSGETDRDTLAALVLLEEIRDRLVMIREEIALPANLSDAKFTGWPGGDIEPAAERIIGLEITGGPAWDQQDPAERAVMGLDLEIRHYPVRMAAP